METPDSDDSPRSALPSDYYSICAEEGDLEPGEDREDINGSGVAPPRPTFLGELLDAQNNHYATFDDKYFMFLQYAIDAIELANESPMVVNVALKVGDVGQEHGSGNEAVTHVASGKVPSNNNFRKLFFFYSSFGEVVEGSSFEKIGNETQTWSHTELETFLRDFGVLPRLLSRDEMGEVWNDASDARVRRLEKPMSQLDLEDGKEMMARIALFVYLRPGMKRLILATTGIFPGPAEMVKCLLHYMGLDDSEFVNDHIKIGKGRQTQGKLNYVSIHEAKTIGREHYEEDLSYRRMAGSTVKKAALQSKMKKRAASKAAQELTIAQQRVQERQGTSQNTRHRPEKHIPDSIKVMLAKTPPPIDKERSRPGTREGAGSRPGTRDGEDTMGETTTGTQAERDLQLLQMSPRVIEETYLDYWQDELGKVLDRYCQEPTLMREDPHLELSGGAFVDAGHVDSSTPLTIFVHVKNRSAHEMQVDLMARNFEDENDTRITTKSGLLAPGISRQMQVNLRAGRQTGSTVGIMELDLHNKLHAYHETVIVPVFFYVGDHALMGKAMHKPVTAETIRLRYDSLRRERKAAGLPIEGDSWAPLEEIEVPSEVDVEGNASVTSSLLMGSVTSNLATSQAEEDEPRASIARGICVNFSRHRGSWYGRGTVGGGGKAIGAFSKDFIKTSAGSGASVAASLRSSSVSSLLRSGGYSRPSTEKPVGMGRYGKPSSSANLFDDGSVFAGSPH